MRIDGKVDEGKQRITNLTCHGKTDNTKSKKQIKFLLSATKD